MNPIEALEADLAADPYGELREHLAANDDRLLEDLVAMRKSKRLKQEEVAVRMNRSKTAVSNFENLGSDPHLSTIRRYAAAVGAWIETKVTDYDQWPDEGPVTITVSYRKRPSTNASAKVIGPIGYWSTV
jgi:DNA-binding XRE family transcriptional regulator